MFIHKYIYIHKYVCIYIYIRIYIHTYIHVCLFVYADIHVLLQTRVEWVARGALCDLPWPLALQIWGTYDGSAAQDPSDPVAGIRMFQAGADLGREDWSPFGRRDPQPVRSILCPEPQAPIFTIILESATPTALNPVREKRAWETVMSLIPARACMSRSASCLEITLLGN